MSIIEAIILGLLQGATEFLPISSSGHLVLFPAIFGLTQPSLALIAVAHLGTLLAVLIYFGHELWTILKSLLLGIRQRNLLRDGDARLGWHIVVGTIPVAAVGLLLDGPFENVFGNPTAAAVFLLVTAALLIIAERQLSGTKLLVEMSWWDAFLIGLFQSLALLPGISRSGSTMTAAIWRGLNRATAARYSFLLGVPAIFGAGLLALAEVFGSGGLASQWPSFLAAFVAAAISGYACIYFLLTWLRNHSLYIFAVYCALLGFGYLLWTYLA
ncbi:MAG: undecaprenyl-diphosphatase UppP [Chloroflexi bacterium]|jgi:undecaprenyl-diphosphatase|nr:undecaprenyl-diphosphatase UppP [Chloroflexota bacterium]